MKTLERAAEIVTTLVEAGVRATVDPAAFTAPAVLVPPPNRRWEAYGGTVAVWEVHALVGAPLGADADTWATLDGMVDVCAEVLTVHEAYLETYVINGAQLPGYRLRWEETL